MYIIEGNSDISSMKNSIQNKHTLTFLRDCKYLSFSGYKNLQSRKETRESAWRSPGWDECVAYTVPLIREMHSRILSPTTFSPTK